MNKFYCLIIMTLLFSFAGCTADDHSLTNPVAPDGHDPWVIQHQGTYYYCYSRGRGVYVNSSTDLVDALQFNGKRVWSAPRGKEYSREIWAPELHFINGKWYIYVAADDGDNANHRMYALVGRSENPLDEFLLAGKLSDPTDKWAIDGTVMQYNDKLYFIWSGWEGDVDVRQDLYIARMDTPLTINSERVLISQPEYDWEKVETPLVNEGPQVLTNSDGEKFIIYSASGSWSDSYCLGQLKLVGDDPMKKENWQKKSVPVFAGTDKVFSPGHASFTKSPDLKEDWIVYHTAKRKGSGWDRDTNIKRFTWDSENNPIFGTPLNKGEKFQPPSAE